MKNKKKYYVSIVIIAVIFLMTGTVVKYLSPKPVNVEFLLVGDYRGITLATFGEFREDIEEEITMGSVNSNYCYFSPTIEFKKAQFEKVYFSPSNPADMENDKLIRPTGRIIITISVLTRDGKTDDYLELEKVISKIKHAHMPASGDYGIDHFIY